MSQVLVFPAITQTTEPFQLDGASYGYNVLAHADTWNHTLSLDVLLPDGATWTSFASVSNENTNITGAIGPCTARISFTGDPNPTWVSVLQVLDYANDGVILTVPAGTVSPKFHLQGGYYCIMFVSADTTNVFDINVFSCKPNNSLLLFELTAPGISATGMGAGTYRIDASAMTSDLHISIQGIPL